jgi:hypothetical protein
MVSSTSEVGATLLRYAPTGSSETSNMTLLGCTEGFPLEERLGRLSWGSTDAILEGCPRWSKTCRLIGFFERWYLTLKSAYERDPHLWKKQFLTLNSFVLFLFDDFGV